MKFSHLNLVLAGGQNIFECPIDNKWKKALDGEGDPTDIYPRQNAYCR